VSQIVLLLPLIFAASGCNEQRVAKKTMLSCGSQPVNVGVNVVVDPNYGATPEAVYVCEGDTVTWNPAANVDTFVVEFKKDYPFEGNKKNFHKGDSQSPKTKPQKELKVYPYTIVVNGHTFDPQVIGGGNP
jgi:plastocyanin